MKKVAFCVLIAFISVLCYSCNNSENIIDGDADTDNFVDGDGDAEDETESEDIAVTSEMLSGVWAEKFAVSYTFVVPILECRIQALLTGVAKINAIVNEDGTMSYTEEICDFSLNVIEDMYFFVEFTEESIKAIPTGTGNAVFDSMMTNAAFSADQTIDIYGADKDKFTDPLNDELPEELDDIRVVGFEDDIGGVTAKIEGFVSGDVYVVLRMIRKMGGKLVSKNLIQGTVVSDVEMNTLGASSSMLDLQLDLVKRDVPELNRFEMVKLDNNLTCEQIFADEKNIFSYDPVAMAEPMWTEECPKEPAE